MSVQRPCSNANHCFVVPDGLGPPDMGRTSSAVAILEVHGPTGSPGGQAAAAALPGAQSDCLHELFERQADARGAAVALVCGETALSYCELELRANRLAHRLREMGGGPSFLVGIALARSELPIIAILGCLKAGAAYVPIDATHPHDRIRYIIAERENAVRIAGHASGL